MVLTRSCIAGIVLVSFFIAGCGRLASHPLVGTAKEEVSRNERVAAVLGAPIEFNPSVSGRANETDGIAAIQFEARGPKGAGIVVVEGKKLGRGVRLEILVVTVQFNDLENVADAGHRNETTPVVQR